MGGLLNDFPEPVFSFGFCVRWYSRNLIWRQWSQRGFGQLNHVLAKKLFLLKLNWHFLIPIWVVQSLWYFYRLFHPLAFKFASGKVKIGKNFNNALERGDRTNYMVVLYLLILNVFNKILWGIWRCRAIQSSDHLNTIKRIVQCLKSLAYLSNVSIDNWYNSTEIIVSLIKLINTLQQ